MTVDVTTKPRTARKLRRRRMGRAAPARARPCSTPPPARPSPGSTPPASTSPPPSPTAATIVGPKLRKLSFHERAAMLKALGQFLMAHKEEFYAESLRHRRHPRRRLDRHRGRRRHAALLRLQGPPRAAEHPRPHRRRRRAAVEGQHLLRPAHPDAARRRRDPHQRLQLPGLGHAGEGGADLHRRRALDREAGEPDRLSDRARGPPDRRERHPARGRHPAHRRLDRRPARPRHRPGRRHLHRLGLDRAQAAQPARRSSRTPSASPWRPTASTPRSSAPTPRPARRSSTSSSRRSPAR